MRLISCYVEGFGKLRKQKIDLSDGPNCLLKENGWGKSTFAAFIKVMFYGFDGESKRNEIENERKRYRPWAGGVYGGELLFEADGRTYRLQRVFGMRKSDDEFAIYNADTNMPTNDYSENVGEELFQIDSASFVRSVYVGQNDCGTFATDGINAKMGSVSATDSRVLDINNYEKASAALKLVINRMSPTKKTGELYKRKKELASLKEYVRRYGNIELEVKKTRERKEKLESVRTAYSEYRYRVAERDMAAGYFPEEIPKENELRKIIELTRDNERLGARIEAERYTENEVCDDDSQRKDSYRNQVSKFCMIVALLSIIGSAVLGVTRTINMALLVLVSVLSVIVLITGILLTRGKKGKGQNSQISGKDEAEHEYISTNAEVQRYLELLGFHPEEDMLTQLLEIQGRLNNYKLCCMAVSRSIPKDADMDENDTMIDQQSTEVRINKMIAECDMELAELTSELTDIKEKSVQLEQEQQDLNMDMKKYEQVCLTYELLGRAKENYTAKYTEPVMQVFDRYYSCIRNSSDDIQINADMNLSYRAQGMYRNKQTLSLGLKDLADICMRIAMVDVMYKKEPPVIIMDDPFVNLDDRNMSGAAKLMSMLEEKYQIIYFTCSKNRVL